MLAWWPIPACSPCSGPGHRRSVLEAYRKLADMGAKVSGVVLTMVDAKSIPSYGVVVANEYAKDERGSCSGKRWGLSRTGYHAGSPTTRATKRELYELAKAKGVPGRSKMSKRSSKTLFSRADRRGRACAMAVCGTFVDGSNG